MKKIPYLLSGLYIVFLHPNLGAQETVHQSDTVFDGHVVSSDWIDRGISLGVDFSQYLYGELGYFRSNIYEVGGFPVVSTTMNYGLEISYPGDIILAPKIQGRLHAYFFNASLSGLVYFAPEQQYAIKLRPEIGIGLWNFDINYGYNIGMYRQGFEQFNKHMVTIRYYLKIKRKYLNEYDARGNKKP